MDLRSQLLLKHTRHHMLAIRDYVGDDAQRFAPLMELLLSGEYRIQQRASWAVMHCADLHPHLITPYLERLADLLNQPVHDAVKRNTTRILREIRIPEALYGKIVDPCFRLLTDSGSPAAIRYFSMHILLKIVKKEPGLAAELRLSLQESMPYGTAAFQAAAEKALRELAEIEHISSLTERPS